MLRDRARATPNRVAIEYGGREVTYARARPALRRARPLAHRRRADCDPDRQLAGARGGRLRLRRRRAPCCCPCPGGSRRTSSPTSWTTPSRSLLLVEGAVRGSLAQAALELAEWSPRAQRPGAGAPRPAAPARPAPDSSTRRARRASRRARSSPRELLLDEPLAGPLTRSSIDGGRRRGSSRCRSSTAGGWNAQPLLAPGRVRRLLPRALLRRRPGARPGLFESGAGHRQ